MSDFSDTELNQNPNLNLLEQNLYFKGLNDIISKDCTYFSEDSFCNKYQNNKNMLCLSINARSLQAQFTALRNLIDVYNANNVFPQCISIQETWNIDQSFYNIPNYNLFCSTRQKGRGGGVAIYLSSKLHAEVLDKASFFIENLIESLALKISLPDGKKIIFISLYRPNSHKDLNFNDQLEMFLESFTDQLDQLTNLNLPVFFFTDSNINLFDCGHDQRATLFADILSSYGYVHSITKATRFNNLQSFSLIDHIFHNDKLARVQSSGIITDAIADHYIPFIELDFHPPKHTGQSKYRRNMATHNKVNFLNSLNNLTWYDVLSESDTNSAFNNFSETFSALFDLHFPIVKVNQNRNNQPLNPFMTRGLLKSRKTKLKLMKKAKAQPSEQNKQILVRYRNVYNAAIKKAKKICIQHDIKKAGNDSKKIWDVINSTKNSKKQVHTLDSIMYNDVLIQDKIQIANILNDYFSQIGHKVADAVPPSSSHFSDYLPPRNQHSIFLSPITRSEMLNAIFGIQSKLSTDINGVSMSLLHFVAIPISIPLTHIFNISIENGVFPDKAKISKVIPVYKNKGSKLEPSNYRGISMVDSFSKIFEKVMSTKLLNFLNRHEFFDPLQFGFLKGHSTNQAIIKFFNFVTDAINDGKFALSINLDVEKCFDSISHEILFAKLQNAGIRGTALDWFKSFLSNRKQRVKIGDYISESLCSIDISVLQGSILGVILFIIFINDLRNCSNELISILFADDLNSLISDYDLQTLISRANAEIENLNQWYRANKLSIHPGKSRIMLFHSPFYDIDIPIVNGNPYLPIFMNNNNPGDFNISKICPLRMVPNNEESTFKFLGINIDNKLNLSYHLKSIHGKVARTIYSLNQVKNLLDEKCLKMIYFAHFHSYFSYCSNLLCVSYEKDLKPLFILQKKAIRIITKSKSKEHTTPLFQKLSILPLHKLIYFNVLKFMFQYTRNLLPTTFDNTWVRNIDRGGYVLRNALDFYVPWRRYSYLNKHPLFNFPQEWNSLDDRFKEIETQNKFLKTLKCYILENLES